MCLGFRLSSMCPSPALVHQQIINGDSARDTVGKGHVDGWRTDLSVENAYDPSRAKPLVVKRATRDQSSSQSGRLSRLIRAIEHGTGRRETRIRRLGVGPIGCHLSPKVGKVDTSRVLCLALGEQKVDHFEKA